MNWTFEEDFIVGKFYLLYLNDWKEHLDELLNELKEFGYGSRDFNSIKMRIQNYEYLHTGTRGLKNAAKQTGRIYRGIVNAKAHTVQLNTYIHQNYQKLDKENLIDFGEPTGQLTDFVCPKEIGPSFSQVLFRFIDIHKKNDSDVYKKSNVSKQTFSDIRNNKAKVSKKTVLQLCVGAELSYNESVQLMEAAGYAFSNNNMIDIIISWHLQEKIYDTDEIDVVLYEYKLPTLFSIK